jgi:putative ABC transport system permease protein
METLWQDLRYSLRSLFKRPGFTVIAILTLALGIGANTAIFSVVNGVLLRPLSFAASERLVALWEVRSGEPRNSVSYPNFRDWRAQQTAFERIAVYRENPMILTGGSEPANLAGIVTSPDLFPLLGATPLLGRVFQQEEEVAGHYVAILSQSVWQKHFLADPQIIGRQVTLNGHAFTVVGVMPAKFDFPVRSVATEIWVTSAIDAEKTDADDDPMSEQRGFRSLKAIGRLKPGATIKQAQADLDAIVSRLQKQYPEDMTNYGAGMAPLLDDLVGDVRSALLVLFIAVLFVLLIVCANVANLLLARAVTRRKEIAVRTALGASRWRIVRQLLTESALLAFLGGAVGLLVALWGTELLKTLGPENLPRVQEISVDGRVLGFTMLISLLTGMIFGLVPALRASRTDLNETLKETGRSSESIHRNQLRSTLIVAEVALALILLTGAGLLVKSFLRLRQVNPGFEPKQVLTLRFDLPEYRYREVPRINEFNRQILERIERLPDVKAAGLIFPLPLSGSNAGTRFSIEGRPVERGQLPRVDFRTASAGYFRALSIPLLSGRDFTARDDLKAPNVVIVNETLARRYFPNENAVGKRISPDISIGSGEAPMREIVGVVGDIKHRGPGEETLPEVYLPHAQLPFGPVTVVVRTGHEPLGIVKAIRAEVNALDPELPLADVQTLDEYLTNSVAQPQFNARLLAIFGAIAMILTAIGLYGVMAYSVAERTRELGIRRALGAQVGDLLGLVIRQGMKLVLAGVVVGMAGALALTHLISGLLFGVTATDPLTFVGSSLLVTIVTLLACWIPAWRATKVDPIIALRCE